MAEEFSRAVARVVAAQLAEVAGFNSVQGSAIEVLAELLTRYLSEACSASHNYAEMAGRTDINVGDVLLALQDMGTKVEDLHAYLSLLVNSPQADAVFAHPLAPYPVRKEARPPPTFADKQEAPPPHIPPFLPAFPDKHTYVRTEVPAAGPLGKDKAAQAKAAEEARMQQEEALHRLKSRQANLTEDSEQTATGAAAAADGQQVEAQQAAGNPFLAPPSVEAASAAMAGAGGSGIVAAHGAAGAPPLLAAPGTRAFKGVAAAADLAQQRAGGEASSSAADGHVGWKVTAPNEGIASAQPAVIFTNIAAPAKRAALVYASHQQQDAYAADDGAAAAAGGGGGGGGVGGTRRRARGGADTKRQVENILAKGGKLTGVFGDDYE